MTEVMVMVLMVEMIPAPQVSENLQIWIKLEFIT